MTENESNPRTEGSLERLVGAVCWWVTSIPPSYSGLAFLFVGIEWLAVFEGAQITVVTCMMLALGTYILAPRKSR